MFKNKLFRKTTSRTGFVLPETPLDRLIVALEEHTQREGTGGSSFVTREQAGMAISMESLNEQDEQLLSQSFESLETAMESIADTLFGANAMSVAQKQAGAVAAMLSGDMKKWHNAPFNHQKQLLALEGVYDDGRVTTTSFVNPLVADAMDGRLKAAMEAYDDKENKNAVLYNVAYNMQAARQDEFGEAFYPTVVITPDQVGFAISIRLIQVYPELRRQISGNIDQFNKRNIVQAVIDPSILENNQTDIVPVVRTQSLAHFVSPSLVGVQNVMVGTESVPTAPLLAGDNLSLLAISQTDSTLETGLMDTTDSIDPASLRLKAIYISTVNGGETDVLKFTVRDLPLSVFNYSPQDNYKVMLLNFNTTILQVTGTTQNVAGAVPSAYSPIASNNYTVRLSISVSGRVNTELGDTNVFAGNVEVAAIYDTDGNSIDPTTGQGLTVANLFQTATFIGYDLEAKRTDLNRRQRGQLLDTTYFNQIYNVPLRAPITVPRPQSTGDANDSSDLAALITTTHIRTSNSAVAELLAVQSILAEFVNTNTYNTSNGIKEAPAILGVSRFILQAYYEHDSIDVATVIDSLKSHERAADIQAVLVNKLRDMAYRMYRDSGWKAAADALAGGTSATPTVIIGTDPVLARYLTVTGDFRTLGNDFQVKIVSTLNLRMAGKIIMVFGAENQGMDGVPNPMHFGNMAWKPEFTTVLPLTRNGAYSKELTVQPSYLHITNVPVMAALDVTGIPTTVNQKIPLNMFTVQADPV